MASSPASPAASYIVAQASARSKNSVHPGAVWLRSGGWSLRRVAHPAARQGVRRSPAHPASHRLLRAHAARRRRASASGWPAPQRLRGTMDRTRCASHARLRAPRRGARAARCGAAVSSRCGGAAGAPQLRNAPPGSRRPWRARRRLTSARKSPSNSQARAARQRRGSRRGGHPSNSGPRRSRPVVETRTDALSAARRALWRQKKTTPASDPPQCGTGSGRCGLP